MSCYRNQRSWKYLSIWKIALMISALGMVSMSGCGSGAPPIVPASGTLTINGKPLNNAEIRFVPMAEGLDGNYVASAFSDDDGNFELSLPTKPGCCACECKVTIVEGPAPDEARRLDEEKGDSRLMEKFRRSLKNRPIPPAYGRLGTTPFVITVTPDKTTYDLELKPAE